MKMTSFTAGLVKITDKERVLENEPMSRHTSFKTGGPARWFVMPGNEEEILSLIDLCESKGVEYFFLGNGSNVLCKDEGYPGVIICLGKHFRKVSVSEEGRVTAEAGMLMSGLSQIAAENCLSGMEFMSGIPGSVGGGIFMNAGAYGSEIKDIIESVTCLAREGGGWSRKVFNREECGMSYRKSVFSEMECVICEGTFRLKTLEDSETIYAGMKDLNNRRAEKQPLSYPSAGSAFKRPENGFAAKLIEDAGLKGLTVGGAQVSEKHSGFIINTGNATSSDIFELIMTVRARVYEHSGILLEPEIRFLGSAKGGF